MILTRFGALAVLAGLAWAADYTEEQLKARFYYDLGPAEIDVSGYPKKERERYSVFSRACSQCHTLARPINSPIVARKDWKRYVERMHLRTKVKAGASISKGDAREIVDFLAYDSQVRKAQGKAAFESKSQELRALFEKVQAERSRRRAEEDKRKARRGSIPGDARPRP